MTTVIEMMLLPSPSNYLGRLLSIGGQVSLAVELSFSLIQHRLASRENFRAMANFKELSGIPQFIEKDSGRSAPAPASLSALLFPEMSQCPRISVTLIRSESRLR